MKKPSGLPSEDGTPIAIQDSAAPIQDRRGNVGGAVMVFHDVSQERQLHRKLSYHASHDSLTGLINRREFEERQTAEARFAHALDRLLPVLQNLRGGAFSWRENAASSEAAA